jgi:hypothetical protein
VILSLVFGTVLAALALAFVLGPVLVGSARPPDRSMAADGRERLDSSADGADTGARPIDVLREIEFDRATGKLSDDDYDALKSTYTARALAELRAPPGRVSGTSTGRPLRSRAAGPVTRVSHCPACNARTPADAVYCPACARYLAGACPACTGPVRLPAARYCSWCGIALREEARAG